MFDDVFLKALPDDVTEAGKLICDRFFEYHNSRQGDKNIRKYFDRYLEALAFADGFIESHDIKLKLPSINYDTGSSRSNLQTVINFFVEWKQRVETELKRRKTLQNFENARNRYAASFGKFVFYEFSDKDFEKVQILINELRDLISKSKDFEEGHKRRLLRRLEKLQSELHKRMSNLDILWGLIGDAGVVLGKFGKDAKPLFDRISEILQITARVQAKAENIEKILPLRLLTEGNNNSDTKKTKQR